MDRMLTTHAGSLPRPPELVKLLSRQAAGEPIVDTDLDDLATAAVDDIVRRQMDAGVDIVNDGEQGRESFFTYLQHRLSGFVPGGEDVGRTWQDVAEFPGFAAQRRERMQRSARVNLGTPPVAVADVRY